MESPETQNTVRSNINPSVVRIAFIIGVAFLITAASAHLLSDSIIIPAFISLCAVTMASTESKLTGMDKRFLILSFAVGFAFFILLNRYETLSGGYFAFGKSLGFMLGEIPFLAFLLIAIPVVLAQNLIRTIHQSIYIRALAGSALTVIAIGIVLFSGPFTDVFYWENILPAPAVFLPVFVVSFFLSFAGLQLNYGTVTRFYREVYLAWIIFWAAEFVIHQIN
jgi:hypothetical protein